MVSMVLEIVKCSREIHDTIGKNTDLRVENMVQILKHEQISKRTLQSDVVSCFGGGGWIC